MTRLNHVFLTLIALASTNDVALACDSYGEPLEYRLRDFAGFVAVANGASTRNAVNAKVLTGRDDGGVMTPGPVVLVPWAIGWDCKPQPWNATRDGVWSPPAGVAAFYTGRLRARGEWMNGTLTIDIERATFQPAWKGSDADGHRYPAAAGPLLTPFEFFDFYTILPTEQELESRDWHALVRAETWEATHREIAVREPARSILRFLRRQWRRPDRAAGTRTDGPVFGSWTEMTRPTDR